MTYGRLLERRRNGVYYFRQVLETNGKQISKRISLRTTDIRIAKFIALQFKARIEMIDAKNIKKFNISYDSEGRPVSVQTTDSQDARDLNEFLKLQEAHRAEAHKRDMERLKFQQQLLEGEQKQREQAAYLQSPKGQEMTALRERLEEKLKPREVADQLTPLKQHYLEELTTTENTKYKYNNFISKFIDYCTRHTVYDITGVDRKLVYSYLLYLRKEEAKSDNTIKNIFNTLSTFFNHLIQTGETSATNPFTGHKLNTEESGREPFTLEDLNAIFSCDGLRRNQKLFYICLLLLTTGARPNEICQLWTDDITLGDDINTIRIVGNKERDQTLKTASSKRIIYLHPLLVKLGFLQYLNGKNLGMVFDLKKPATKTYSTFISEEFTQILRSLGIEKKTMYCFRHTVINRLKQAKVLQTINEDLVGHEGQGTNAKVYSQQHSAENLRDETQEILSYREVKPLHGQG
ncbi:MAG: tyrosine-type recombinase/integrase [Pseudacidovorax sp.]|nr:tyrosine-type recombinase/integrase [Pseudacidovorax sp.]